MAFEGKLRWVLRVYEPVKKRRYVEHSWHATEREAREAAKKLPKDAKWQIAEY